MEGFIPIKRSLFDHFLFAEKRVFSRFEAWLDLIQMATFQEEYTRLVKGKPIKCRKGQLVASVRFLQDRWSWSTHKVCDFIELLRSQQMLLTDKEEGVNRITLVNFKKHNEMNFTNSKRDTERNSETPDTKDVKDNEGTVKGTQKGTVREQSGNSQGTNNNKGNKGKKGNNDDVVVLPSSLFGSATVKSIEDLKADCLKDKVYFVEHVCRQNRISEYQVTKALEAFNEHLLSIGEGLKSVKDYRTHFQSWLKKQDMKAFRLNSQHDHPAGSVSDTLKSIGL